MKEIPLHFLPILVAAVVRAVIGGLWYSPLLFGPPFMRLTGCTDGEMKARLPAALVSDIIGSLIMSFILVHAVYYAGASTVGQGVAVGLFNWLGFVLVTHFGLVAFEKRPMRLFAINMGFQALSLAVMGALLATWQ